MIVFISKNPYNEDNWGKLTRQVVPAIYTCPVVKLSFGCWSKLAAPYLPLPRPLQLDDA